MHRVAKHKKIPCQLAGTKVPQTMSLILQYATDITDYKHAIIHTFLLTFKSFFYWSKILEQIKIFKKLIIRFEISSKNHIFKYKYFHGTKWSITPKKKKKNCSFFNFFVFLILRKKFWKNSVSDPKNYYKLIF